MMHRDNWTVTDRSPVRTLSLILFVALTVVGCELGWQDTGQPSLDEASAVAAARGVAQWAADSSDCNLQVVRVEHVKRFGPLDKLSDEIANNTPVLDGVQGCDTVIRPGEVQDQNLFPTGSRSNYRSVMEKLLDDSPTDAEHVVRVEWNAPSGGFSTLTAVNADSLKVLFSPVGTMLGSDVAAQDAMASRTDALNENGTPAATWTPRGGGRERLIWQDSLKVELEGAGTLPVDHGRTLAKTAPEITAEWNSDAEVTESTCTVGSGGVATSTSIDPAVSTAEFFRQLAETDRRTEWRDGECALIFQVDVGIAEGNATMSSSTSTSGPGSEISKSGVGQFWTFRRTYEWIVTP